MRFILIILTIIGLCSNSFAAKAKKAKKCTNHSPIETALVVDANTGKVLYSENPMKKIYPASLTKLMTLYLLFDWIESGKFSMERKLYVSSNAAQMKPCKLHLKAGEYISVKNAILALIVRSANDVAVVVAENIAGSETKFAKMMTRKARQLGMLDTTFTNASGWHHIELQTTAVDLAKLAMALRRDHPTFYPLFSRTSFKFNNKVINGHNHVTANYSGAEGLKTGYTSNAGYNLVTTASKSDKTLIGIVTGSKSSNLRDRKMIALLDKYFGVKTSANVIKKKVLAKMSNKTKKKHILAKNTRKTTKKGLAKRHA